MGNEIVICKCILILVRINRVQVSSLNQQLLSYRSRLSFPGRRASASLINLVATNLVFKGRHPFSPRSIHPFTDRRSRICAFGICSHFVRRRRNNGTTDDHDLTIHIGARFFYIRYWRSIGFPLKSALPEWIGKNCGKIYTQIRVGEWKKWNMNIGFGRLGLYR